MDYRVDYKKEKIKVLLFFFGVMFFGFGLALLKSKSSYHWTIDFFCWTKDLFYRLGGAFSILIGLCLALAAFIYSPSKNGESMFKEFTRRIRRGIW